MADDPTPPPTCTPFAVTPPSTATPVKWTRPADTVMAPRRAAWDLDDSDVARLRSAYAKMRALPATDGRSLTAQRNLHAYYCNAGDANEIHGHWTFLPWHRMFLYFHERILGALIGDPALRLPYWDWETAAHSSPPPAYATPAVATNPLYDATRFLKAGQTVQRWLTNRHTQAQRYYQLSLVHRLFDCTFAQFGGTPTSGGVVEAGSHGYVHVSCGGDATRYDPLPCSGDLAILNTAALDPIFFSHHANLDRLWKSWESMSGNTNPADPAWQNLAFTFFDEHGTWTEMSVKQLAPTEAQLGYRYDRPIGPLMTAMRSTPAQHITLQQNGRGVAPPPRAAALAAKNPELALTDLVLPGDGDFRLSVRSSRGSKALADLFVVPHGMNGMQAHAMSFNVCVALPPDSVSILLGANPQFTLQPSSAPAPRGLTASAAAGPVARAGKIELVLR